ncbi:MAG: hypothetical protein ACHQ52_01080 [Candidatus Eisenbacteria bacterium]
MAAGGATGVGVLLVMLAVPSLACARRFGRGLAVHERVLLGMALGPPLLGLTALPFLAGLRMPPVTALEVALFLAVVAAAWPLARRDRAPDPRLARSDAFPTAGAFALAALAVLMVAIPAIAVPFVRLWSDAWFHAGAAIEVLRRGLPPQDPNFAGIPFHYPWFFHVLLALLMSGTGLSAFTLQSALDIWYVPVLTLAAADLAWRVAGRRAARPAMVIVLIGLNPFGAWLWLAHALLRHHGGLGAAWQRLAGVDGAIQAFAFGFSPTQSTLLDRFWTGTALTPAIAIGLALAWSLASLLGGGPRRGATRAFLLALAAMAIHPAYAVLVAAGLGVGLVASLPGGSRPRETVGGIVALGLAAALAIPYVRYCSVPGVVTPARIGLYGPNLLAMTVAAGVWWLIALPALLAALRRGAQERMLLAALLVTTAMAVCVVLPERNSEKIFYAAWVLLAPFAAAGATLWPRRLRVPEALVWGGTLALALPTTLLCTAGVLRESRSPAVLVRGYAPGNERLPLATPGEAEAYRRLRDTTPADLVVIESPRPTVNEPVPVLAERRVFCGSLDVYLSNHFGSEAWAAAEAGGGPPGGLGVVRVEFTVRRGIQRALFGAGLLSDAQRRYLDAFGAPLVLMVRHREVDDRVWTRFDTSPDWDRALHNDEVKLYRWKGAPAGRP